METAVNIIWVSVDSGYGQKLRHLISNRFEEGAELFHQKNKVRYKIMFVYFVLQYNFLLAFSKSEYFKNNKMCTTMTLYTECCHFANILL